MTRRITVFPQAERDIEDQIAYLSEDNIQAAIRFCNASEHTFALLASMPGMGALYPSDDPRLHGVRSFHMSGFERHLVFYKEVPDGIEVIRVLHRARDIESILG